AFWLRHKTNNTFQVPISKYQDSPSNDWSWVPYINASAWRLASATAPTSGNVDVSMNLATQTNGVWHHYIIERNGTAGKIYVDNIAQNPAVTSATDADNSVSLHIGNYNASSAPLDGYLDSIVITTSILTAAERALLFAFRTRV